MAVLSNIFVYPVKALDGIETTTSKITSSGALENDRRFCFTDSDDKILNGKRSPEIMRVRSSFDLSSMSAEFIFPGEVVKYKFNLLEEQKAIADIFSSYLNMNLKFIQDDIKGFFDDEIASGPTIVSLASLEEVSTWFPELPVEVLIKRFRVNLIVSDTEIFWEDKLYGDAGETVSFNIGGVSFEGINPCKRCVVPTRDLSTGETDKTFSKIFIEKRKSLLPNWVDKKRFDTYYRFVTNTRIDAASAGEMLSTGSAVRI